MLRKRNANSTNHVCNCASFSLRLRTRFHAEARRVTRTTTLRMATRTTTTGTTTTTETTTKRPKRRTQRRCPRRSLLTHWGVGGGCTLHYPQLQSSYKIHFHLSTYLRMRPVSRGLFRSAPNEPDVAPRAVVFPIDYTRAKTRRERGSLGAFLACADKIQPKLTYRRSNDETRDVNLYEPSLECLTFGEPKCLELARRCQNSNFSRSRPMLAVAEIITGTGGLERRRGRQDRLY